jgi:hypothetical protein
MQHYQTEGKEKEEIISVMYSENIHLWSPQYLIPKLEPLLMKNK